MDLTLCIKRVVSSASNRNKYLFNSYSGYMPRVHAGPQRVYERGWLSPTATSSQIYNEQCSRSSIASILSTPILFVLSRCTLLLVCLYKLLILDKLFLRLTYFSPVPNSNRFEYDKHFSSTSEFGYSYLHIG